MYVINGFLFDHHTLNPLDLEEVTIVLYELIIVIIKPKIKKCSVEISVLKFPEPNNLF